MHIRHPNTKIRFLNNARQITQKLLSTGHIWHSNSKIRLISTVKQPLKPPFKAERQFDGQIENFY